MFFGTLPGIAERVLSINLVVGKYRNLCIKDPWKAKYNLVIREEEGRERFTTVKTEDLSALLTWAPRMFHLRMSDGI